MEKKLRFFRCTNHPRPYFFSLMSDVAVESCELCHLFAAEIDDIPIYKPDGKSETAGSWKGALFVVLLVLFAFPFFVALTARWME